MLLQSLESALNRRIAGSAPARQLCRRLDGRVLGLRIRDTGLDLYVTVSEAGVELGHSAPGEPDAVLEGSPFGLAALAGSATPPRGSVHLAGDPEVARLARELLQLARPDWEEELARVIGDVPAHQVGNAWRGAVRWSRQTLDTLSRDAAEFLQEESRDLPAAPEVEAFLGAVDEIRMDTDRLEARIRRLHERLADGPDREPGET